MSMTFLNCNDEFSSGYLSRKYAIMGIVAPDRSVVMKIPPDAICLGTCEVCLRG